MKCIFADHVIVTFHRTHLTAINLLPCLSSPSQRTQLFTRMIVISVADRILVGMASLLPSNCDPAVQKIRDLIAELCGIVRQSMHCGLLNETVHYRYQFYYSYQPWIPDIQCLVQIKSRILVVRLHFTYPNPSLKYQQ